MKSMILSMGIMLSAMVATAQMDLPGDGGNIRATISEEVGITSVTIRYSRPGVKGREGKIWGQVVADGFGNFNFLSGQRTSPWRAGANEATVITFEHDVKVEGQDLKAGSYALFIAMEPDEATLIFSRQAEAWGSFFYREEDDVLRVKVKTVALDRSVERLKYEFVEHEEKSCVIAMQWEKRMVPFRVEVDLYDLVLARLREQVTGVKGFLSANLIHGSMYCFEKGINLEEAVAWAERAVYGRPFGQTGFDAYQNLATGYEKLGRVPEADSLMDQGLAIANLNEFTAYGRTLIRQKRIDRALEVLQAAHKKFGDTYAIHHALALAHSAQGNYRQALEHANQALPQATTDQARNLIRANIEKLKKGEDINE